MRNPTYEGAFETEPRAERLHALVKEGNGPTFSIGIKTITHNRDGLKIIPHKTVVVEMTDGDVLMSFDIPPGMARSLSKRIAEFVDAIEMEKAA